MSEFAFNGCPHKSVVKIRPTKECMIAISEFPFFVIELKDVEVVHFERVQFGIKNFDMAIIYKDFHTFKRISSIPIEEIDGIKQYLNNIKIIYSEGTMSMHWNAVLGEIRENFEDFLDEGGWRFLQDKPAVEGEEGGEDEGSEDEVDPEFKDEVDDSFDESDDGSDDFSEDEEKSSSGFEEDEESEGLSWDELEKKAHEEDKQAAAKRNQNPDDRGVARNRQQQQWQQQQRRRR